MTSSWTLQMGKPYSWGSCLLVNQQMACNNLTCLFHDSATGHNLLGNPSNSKMTSF
jgi:hypothetical protein